MLMALNCDSAASSERQRPLRGKPRQARSALLEGERAEENNLNNVERRIRVQIMKVDALRIECCISFRIRTMIGTYCGTSSTDVWPQWMVLADHLQGTFLP
jgi:hypothetical protein